MHTVLVVDDYEGVRTALAFVLTQRGCRVVTADSGHRAVEVAAREDVDAALVDMMMPGMDGFQTCTALLEQAHARGRRLPTWMMSGAAHSGAERRAREIGVLGLFGKPFDAAQFVAELEAWWASPPAESPPQPPTG